jgi:hypothetical protein
MNSLVLKRLVKFSWIIISVTIIISIASTSLLSGKKYEANITLGLSFNNPKLMETGIDPVNVETPNFIEKQGKLSRFLENRLASVESQQIIVNELQLEQINLSADKPIYKLRDQEMGFISITYTTDYQPEAERFNKVMFEQVYKSIINQWNDSKIENFQITGIQNPVQSVQVKTVTLQEKLIAPISVFILSVLLTITWPEPKNNKK